MIPLTAREALDPQVVRVTAAMCSAEPAQATRGTGTYAVFDEETGAFLGVVTERACTQFPQRIFADVLAKPQPAPVAAETPIEAVSQRMEAEGVEALPVLEEPGTFLGIITRPSLLEALLRREQEHLAEARRLQEQLQAEQQHLAARSERFEELLRTTEKRLKHLVSSTPAVIYTCEPSPPYGATFISENVKQQLGYDPREFVEDPRFWADHIHPEDAPRIFTNLSQLFNHDRHIHEYRFRHQDGTYRWMRDELKLVRDAQGRPLEIVGYWSDITDRKRVEEQVRAQSRTLELFFKWTLSPLAFLDRDFNFLRVNEAYAHADERDVSEFPGRNHFDLYPSEAKAIFEEVVRTKKPFQAFARPFVYADHPERGMTYWDWTLVPVLDTAGEVELLVLSLSDVTERKRAEDALAHSEQRFRELVQSLDVIVWEADATTWQFTFVSQRAEAILGYPVKQWLTGPEFWANHIHLDDREEAVTFCREAVAEGRDHAFEYRSVAADGRAVWLRDIVRVVKDQEGRVRQLRGVMVDITARNRAEEALRESEQKHRMVLENIDEIVYAVRTTEDDQVGGTVQFVSGRVENILGYEPDEFLNDPGLWFRLVHPDDVPALRESTHNIFATGKGGTRVYRLRQKEPGEYRWMEDRVAPRLDTAGNVIGLFGVARDITERKQVEEALREMNVAIANAMPGISRLDAEGRYINVNEAYSRMLGYECGEMIGTDWKLTIYPEDWKNAIAAYGRMFSEGKAEFEARAVRKDGSVFHKHVLMVKIVSKGGDFTGHHCFMRDITERKRAEVALRESEERQAAILRSVPVVLYCAATTGDLPAQWMSENALSLTGFPAEQFLAHPDLWVSRLHPEDRARVLQTFAGVQGGDPLAAEYRWQRADGTYRWFLDQVVFVRRSEGQPAQFIGTWLDITERKQAEEALLAHTFQIEAVRAISTEITRELDLSALLKLITRRATELVGAEVGVVLLWNEAAQVLVPQAWHGFGDWIGEVHLRLGQGLAGAVADRRQGMIVNDYRSSPYALPLFVERSRSNAAVAEPLLYRDRLVGVIVVGSNESGRAFAEEDRETLAPFAAQAAIAIENARLFDQVRAGRERMQALSRRFVEMQEVERKHLARELHDEMGQALTAVKMSLQGIQHLSESEPLRFRLEESIAVVEQAIQQARDLSLDLRPSMLDDLGLVAALRWHLDRSAQRAGFGGKFVAECPDVRVSPEIETACFRIAQEALANVVRHAQARHVLLEMRQSDTELHLVIQDDGTGFDVHAAQEHAARGGSFGLLGMQERVRLVGGSVEINSTSRGGTTIRARFPLVKSLERRGKKRVAR